jgi:hypothetical protein
VPSARWAGLFHEALDLKWAVLECPWAIEHGDSTIQLCKDRGVAFFADTQGWRYWDSRTFATEKFTGAPYAPARPLVDCTREEVRSFLRASLEAQYKLGASAYLLPGVVPSAARQDVHDQALDLIGTAEDVLSSGLPCVAFVGAHTSSMDATYQLVRDLPSWLTGVYLQLTPMNPLHDSPSKIIDYLNLLSLAAKRDLVVIGGRLAGLGLLARRLGVHGVDAGLGEGESFDYGAKIASYLAARDSANTARPIKGRLYVPQLGRSLSSEEWGRLMQVPAVAGLGK